MHQKTGDLKREKKFPTFRSFVKNTRNDESGPSAESNLKLCAPWEGAISQWELAPPGNYRSSR